MEHNIANEQTTQNINEELIYDQESKQEIVNDRKPQTSLFSHTARKKEEIIDETDESWALDILEELEEDDFQLSKEKIKKKAIKITTTPPTKIQAFVDDPTPKNKDTETAIASKSDSKKVPSESLISQPISEAKSTESNTKKKSKITIRR